MEEIFRSTLVLAVILWFIYCFLYEITILTGLLLFVGFGVLIVEEGNVIWAAVCLVLSFFCLSTYKLRPPTNRRDPGYPETNYTDLYIKLGIPAIVISFYSFGLYRLFY